MLVRLCVMSHNNYFTTIKRRIHPHINNHADPPVSYPKTENHQIFFSRPTSIGSDSNQILLKYPPSSFLRAQELLRTRSFKIHLNHHLTEVIHLFYIKIHALIPIILRLQRRASESLQPLHPC